MCSIIDLCLRQKLGNMLLIRTGIQLELFDSITATTKDNSNDGTMVRDVFLTLDPAIFSRCKLIDDMAGQDEACGAVSMRRHFLHHT